MGKLEGSSSSGGSKDFSVSGKTVMTEAVSYSVSFARGLATIPVAGLMCRVSHKRATLLAMFLNTAAVPLIYAPYYSLFVIGRMIMGFGGTMLIILIQPILVRFFDLKHKGILSMITPMAYILGALLSNLLFVEDTFAKKLQTNGKTVALVCAVFSYFPLIFYSFLGKNFKTADNAQEEIDQEDLPENTYFGIIKEKNLGFWIIGYSLLLVSSLIVSLKVPDVIEKINSSLVTNTFNGNGNGKKVSWKSLYTICFYCGCLAGIVLGRWNKTEYRRKPFIVLSCFMGVLFGAIILAVASVKGSSNVGSTVIIYISAFLFAFFSMGIQSVILYIPHEYPENNNAKRLTIFYSYLGGMGYIIFTLYQIINASFMSIQSFGYGLSAGVISLGVLMFGAFALFIKEPRPEFKLHPGVK